MHVAKFNKGSSSRIIAHCNRDRKTNTESNINWDLTPNNYSFHQLDVAEFQANETKYAKRKDAVTLCSVILTLPKELQNASDGRIEEFFQKSYEAIKDYWGGVPVYADVHLDETTPHLHYGFMPIKDGKLQAKNIVNRQALQGFHSAIEQALRKQGIDVHLQEQDEIQRQINHDLGLSTKSLSNYKDDVITANTEVVREQIIEVQKSLVSQARSVKRQPDESKQDYKQRKSEYIVVPKAEFQFLSELNIEFNSTEIKAKSELLKAETEQAKADFNTQAEQYKQFNSKLKEQIEEYEKAEKQYKDTVGTLEQKYSAIVRDKLKKQNAQNISAVYIAEEQRTNSSDKACSFTQKIFGRNTISNVFKLLSDHIRQAFNRFWNGEHRQLIQECIQEFEQDWEL